MQASDVTLRLIRSNETTNANEVGTYADLVHAMSNNVLKTNEVAFA